MTSHAEQVLTRLRRGRDAALEAMGRTGAALTQAQMLSGYARPIRDSGALVRDVSWRRDGNRVLVGNTLPYAAAVHQGTRRTLGRPYLADALTGGGEQLAQAAAQRLKEAMR